MKRLTVTLKESQIERLIAHSRTFTGGELDNVSAVVQDLIDKHLP